MSSSSDGLKSRSVSSSSMQFIDDEFAANEDLSDSIHDFEFDKLQSTLEDAECTDSIDGEKTESDVNDETIDEYIEDDFRYGLQNTVVLQRKNFRNSFLEG